VRLHVLLDMVRVFWHFGEGGNRQVLHILGNLVRKYVHRSKICKDSDYKSKVMTLLSWSCLNCTRDMQFVGNESFKSILHG